MVWGCQSDQETESRRCAKTRPQERTHRVQQIVIDAPAGQLSAELTRRGIAADAKVHVVVELLEDESLPMAALAEAGRAHDWLANEPELYSDADLVEHGR